jgi:hypothetical protein
VKDAEKLLIILIYIIFYINTPVRLATPLESGNAIMVQYAAALQPESLARQVRRKQKPVS